MSLESWPSFCKSYTRSRKKSYVLILLYVTQGDMQSINANPWCWMPFFTSSAIVFTSPLKARATYVAPDAKAREIGSTGFSMTPSIGVDFVFIPFSDVGLAWPVDRKCGRLLEQPIPDTMRRFHGSSCNAWIAVCNARRTAKSPQPGHQVGLISDLYVSISNSSFMRPPPRCGRRCPAR